MRWWWSYARDSLTISASNQMEIAAHRVDDIFYAQRLSVTLNAIRKIIKSDWAFLKWKAIFIFLAPCSSILSIRLHSFITEIECTKIHSKRTPITNGRKMVKWYWSMESHLATAYWILWRFLNHSFSSDYSWCSCNEFLSFIRITHVAVVASKVKETI